MCIRDSITPERQRVAAFSRPTASVRAAIVVRTNENRLPLRPVANDVRQAQTLRWVTMHDAAENGLLLQTCVTQKQISTVPTAERGLRVVAEGQADALAISAVTAWKLVTQHPQWPLEVRVIGDAPVGWPAFVFRLEDEALRDAFDRELQGFLGSDAHTELVRSFGFTSEERPPDLP